MGLYRCTNDECLLGDFEAETARCPDCDKPALELVVIHFDPPHPKNPERRAGVPLCGFRNTLGGVASTAEPLAVSCPRCKEALSGKD